MTAKQITRLLILVLATSAAVAIGAAVLHSTGNQSGGSVPVGNEPTIDPGTVLPSAADGAPTPKRSVITGRGSAKGYDATVRVVPADGGDSVIDVDLSTESTPASAPTAQAALRGAAGDRRTIGLTIIGAGRWESSPLRLSPGIYLLTFRFDRVGGPLSIPVRIRVP